MELKSPSFLLKGIGSGRGMNGFESSDVLL